MSLPTWARDQPERLLYAANTGGKWELYAWDRPGDRHRQVTDRTDGTLRGTVDPSGTWIWWFDDQKGNELGSWVIEPFEGTGEGAPARPGAPQLGAGYDAGRSLGVSFAVAGRSTD